MGLTPSVTAAGVTNASEATAGHARLLRTKTRVPPDLWFWRWVITDKDPYITRMSVAEDKSDG